jgi:hypothetical protein
MLRRADMRGLLVAIALAVPLGGAALAQTCDDETIDAVATDGSVIKMRSGARFHVDSSDRIDASLWSPLDDVLICKDETEIVNKDKDGERVTVRRLQR